MTLDSLKLDPQVKKAFMHALKERGKSVDEFFEQMSIAFIAGEIPTAILDQKNVLPEFDEDYDFSEWLSDMKLRKEIEEDEEFTRISNEIDEKLSRIDPDSVPPLEEQLADLLVKDDV